MEVVMISELGVLLLISYKSFFPVRASRKLAFSVKCYTSGPVKSTGFRQGDHYMVDISIVRLLLALSVSLHSFRCSIADST